MDLKRWEPFRESLRASSATPGELLSQSIPAPGTVAFYRLLAVTPPRVSKLGAGGEQVFGYAKAFEEELQRIGQISPDEFVAMFPAGASYLPGISWDLTTAQFRNEFNADPQQLNQGKEWGVPGYRFADYRLNSNELALFKKNGFVVSERLGAGSFADVFYALWHADLPVFISCDALLQAWHRTYDAMLEEIEETYLFNSAQEMLDGMAAQVSAASAQVGTGVLRDGLMDGSPTLTFSHAFIRLAMLSHASSFGAGSKPWPRVQRNRSPR